jgi:hypothetical protein
LGDEASVRDLGLKALDQGLDFRFLGEKDLGRDLFFFEPAMVWRVSAMTRLA